MNKILPFIIPLSLTLNVSAQLNDGLLANWPLDGNANDVKRVYDGSFSGDVTSTKDRYGNVGCAVQIGPTNSFFQYYKANSPNNFFFWSNRCTLSFWFMPDDISRTSVAHLARHTFEYSNPYHNNFYIDLLRNDTLDMCKKVATNVTLTKQWNHLVISYDYDMGFYDNTAKIYLNNVLIDSKWFCRGGENFNAFLRFGEGVGTGLDDIRYYDRALSSLEVAELYYLPSSCLTTGTETEQHLSNKTLVRILTPLGREVKQEQAIDGMFIYQYSDGSVIKSWNR